MLERDRPLTGGWRLLTKNGQEDVDEEVCSAAALEEDTDGREEDGEDDLDDVAVKLVSDCCPFAQWAQPHRSAMVVGDLPSGERHDGG